jgi:hypothetical protein
LRDVDTVSDALEDFGDRQRLTGFTDAREEDDLDELPMIVRDRGGSEVLGSGFRIDADSVRKMRSCPVSPVAKPSFTPEPARRRSATDVHRMRSEARQTITERAIFQRVKEKASITADKAKEKKFTSVNVALMSSHVRVHTGADKKHEESHHLLEKQQHGGIGRFELTNNMDETRTAMRAKLRSRRSSTEAASDDMQATKSLPVGMAKGQMQATKSLPVGMAKGPNVEGDCVVSSMSVSPEGKAALQEVNTASLDASAASQALTACHSNKKQKAKLHAEMEATIAGLAYAVGKRLDNNMVNQKRASAMLAKDRQEEYTKPQKVSEFLSEMK